MICIKQWITHNGRDHYGYKDPVKADKKTLLITGCEVTSANIHDSIVPEDLMSKKEDGGQPLHADSAYRSVRGQDRAYIRFHNQRHEVDISALPEFQKDSGRHWTDESYL